MPQYIVIGLFCMNLGLALAKNGEPSGDHSFSAALFSTCLMFGLLWWGGFWGHL